MSPRLTSLLKRLQPGGIILFARNIVSAHQTHGLLKACQQLVSTPLFRCVDMEGGLVDRLKKALEPAPSPAEVFATDDPKLFRKHGKVIGEECCALGFNTDFAPVSDLAFQASRSVMSSRAVSDNPKQTVLYVREFLRGLAEAGVLGCGKHFPGLGEGNLDSHQYLLVIHKVWKRLWGGDLCLICHEEERIVQAHEAIVREVERDGKFADRVAESAARILGFKKKAKHVKRSMPPPTPTKIERLTRQLWEFSEQVRLGTLGRQEQS